MESSNQLNFSLFHPLNRHGRKNRNVILTMLLIWVVAVFGFQFLLRAIQKPTPEKALMMFDSTWPVVKSGKAETVDYKKFLHSLILVRGKNTVKLPDQEVLSNAISCVTYLVVPDSVKTRVIDRLAEINSLKARLKIAKEKEYLEIKTELNGKNKELAEVILPFSGFEKSSLEASIHTWSLKNDVPGSFGDSSFDRLPDIMKLYLTHHQSVLTDSKFLGFPFHYFYTAVFLLLLFVVLCIVYNILVEWRLRKEGVVE